MTVFAFPVPERRARRLTILPLINIVFLLLMFIVLSGTIARPVPLVITPAVSETGNEQDARQLDRTIFVDAAGQVAFRDVRGEAASLAAASVVARQDAAGTLAIRADAESPAELVVRLVHALRQAGAARLELQVERKP